jgi:sigma-B regulation protein RsbU (phosphoserine phosphatase)
MSAGTHTVLQGAFKGLEEETLRELREVAERREYQPGDVICRQGEPGNTFYVIVEGNVAATRKLESGEERLLSVLGPRRYFGEMALIDDTPRMATCTAVTKAHLLEITEEVFDRVLEHSPKLAYRITVHLLDLLRSVDRLSIEELKSKNRELEQAYKDLQAAQSELIVKERLVHELQLAADMQRRLLPDVLPRYPQYDFAALLHPARQVGGDYYDVIPLDAEHVGILIADVADKGFHAALFMAVTYTMFRSSCQDSLSPAEVALTVHHRMFDGRASDLFVTAVYGVLHLPSGRFTYVRAGHDRPLLYRPGQPVQPLPGEGRFLGMIEYLQLHEETIYLQPGDRLLLLSDGVPDAINEAGEHYGNHRLIEALAKYGHASAETLIQQIADDVANWQQKAAPFDDLTLLVIEVKQ